MNKSVEKQKNQNVRAIFWGLIILYPGTFLLVVLLMSYSSFIDGYVFNHVVNTMVHTNSLKDITLTTFHNILGYQSFAGAGWGIAVILNAFLFGISGWIVMKKASNQSWYFAMIPALIILFFVFLSDNSSLGKLLSLPMAPDYIMDFIRPYFIISCLILSLVGALCERHLVLHYKR